MRIPLDQLTFYRNGSEIPLQIINSKMNAFPGVTVNGLEEETGSFCVETEHLEIDTKDYDQMPEVDTRDFINDNVYEMLETISEDNNNNWEDRFHDLNARYLCLLDVCEAQEILIGKWRDLAFV